MGEMGELKTEGIVLRYADYKDADRMLTLLTPDYGLISVSARGVRRQNAKLRFAAELFTYGSYMLNDKNSRYALMGCVLQDSFYSLREDIDKMCAASAMVEIINYAGTQQPQPELFALLRGCLFTLCSGTPPKALLALFIARLLKISGYLPEIEYCISSGSKAEYFIPGEGGICRKCAQKTGTAGLIMLESQTPGFIDGCVCSENETFLCEAEKKTADNAFMLLVRHMQICFDCQFKSVGYFLPQL